MVLTLSNAFTEYIPMSKSKKHIVWIVEDDQYFRHSMELLIDSDNNLKLGLAEGSVEKILNAEKTTEKPEIILQDIGLPGMSGIEAIAHYRKKFPDVLIIMLTIFEDDERIFESIKAGADGYLLKQTPGDEILKSIKDVLDGGASMSPGIAKKVLAVFTEPKKKESPLTKREQTVLKLLVDGMTMDMISGELNISWHTVVSHVKNIYTKLQVHNRSGAVAKAIRDRLV